MYVICPRVVGGEMQAPALLAREGRPHDQISNGCHIPQLMEVNSSTGVIRHTHPVGCLMKSCDLILGCRQVSVVTNNSRPVVHHHFQRAAHYPHLLSASSFFQLCSTVQPRLLYLRPFGSSTVGMDRCECGTPAEDHRLQE